MTGDAAQRTRKLQEVCRRLWLGVSAPGEHGCECSAPRSPVLGVNNDHLQHCKVLPINLLPKTQNRDAIFQGMAAAARGSKPTLPVPTRPGYGARSQGSPRWRRGPESGVVGEGEEEDGDGLPRGARRPQLGHGGRVQRLLASAASCALPGRAELQAACTWLSESPSAPQLCWRGEPFLNGTSPGKRRPGMQHSLPGCLCL